MPEETTETTEATTVTTPETGESDDLATLKLTLQKERDARKALEKEVKPLRTFKDERTKAEQTESERLQARIKDLDVKEQTLTQRERTIAVRDGLAAAATAEKLELNVSTATVIRLLDLDRVEFDDSGTPINLGPLLKQLAKDEPKMFDARRRSGSADGGASGGVAGQDMNSLLRRAAGRGQ